MKASKRFGAGDIVGFSLSSRAGGPIQLTVTNLSQFCGYSTSILAGLFSNLFGRIFDARRRFLALGLSPASNALYMVLVGGNPSVARAVLMAGLSLFARTISLRQDGLNSLAFMTAGMWCSNPIILWYAGFQLSFTITLGMILDADHQQGTKISLVVYKLIDTNYHDDGKCDHFMVAKR